MKSDLRLGIMQPYFFPYLGYFDLILRTNLWVVFDVVQYNAKSWMTRNRILHPTKGWQYVGVSVQKAPRGTLIRDIIVLDPDAALVYLLGQLEHYKKRAPYFHKVVDLVRGAFVSVQSNRLVELNVVTLSQTCAYLDIPLNWSLCSEMDLELEGIEHAGQWALRISEQLGADKYINPPGGREIFNPKEWAEAGIELEFTEPPKFSYSCPPPVRVH